MTIPHARWKITQTMAAVSQVKVFSGGACNLISAQGQLLRNRERDTINDWLTERDITFFDPQIHPDTHGTEYNYQTHYPMELAARDMARIRLYEVSPLSFGGISSLEIAMDHFRYHEPMVVYYSDGNPENDVIPTHSPKGYPLFVPANIHTEGEAQWAHYKEFIKNANNMRKYLMRMAQEMNTLTISFNDQPAIGDVVITPHRMHATDMFRAVVRAASNERVFVTFTGVLGHQTTRDERGNPRFLAPTDPPPVEKAALLDQYVDEGNALRKAIAELIEINVFVRVVYTQRSALLALEELLKVVDLK